MNCAEYGVAVTNFVDQDTNANKVVNVVKLSASNHHLLVDRVILLWAAVDLALDFCVTKILINRINDVLDELLALRRALSYEIDYLLINLWVEDRKRNVF